MLLAPAADPFTSIGRPLAGNRSRGERARGTVGDMQLEAIARDALTAARATWGVASSGPMPRWTEWMEWIDAERGRATAWNPDDRAIEAELVRLARGRATDGLPWDAMRSPASRRLYAGLVSFVDDHQGPCPSELFPRERALALRTALRSDLPRTIPEQFAIALPLAGGHAFAAAILLHAVTRQIARDRDARALGSIPWDERLRDAASIAPFAPEIAGRGDAPGDTYHYWANVAAGYHAEHRGRLVPRAVGAAFYAGPIAMTWIRGRLFASPLFAGAHTLCDRMGLRHGRALARAGRPS